MVWLYVRTHYYDSICYICLNLQRVEGLYVLYILIIVIMEALYVSALPITLSNVGLVNKNIHLYFVFISRAVAVLVFGELL